MSCLPKICSRLRQDQSGVTAVEYALIAALVGLVTSGVLLSFGNSASAILTKIGTTIAGA